MISSPKNPVKKSEAVKKRTENKEVFRPSKQTSFTHLPTIAVRPPQVIRTSRRLKKTSSRTVEKSLHYYIGGSRRKKQEQLPRLSFIPSRHRQPSSRFVPKGNGRGKTTNIVPPFPPIVERSPSHIVWYRNIEPQNPDEIPRSFDEARASRHSPKPDSAEVRYPFLH